MFLGPSLSFQSSGPGREPPLTAEATMEWAFQARCELLAWSLEGAKGYALDPDA